MSAPDPHWQPPRMIDPARLEPKAPMHEAEAFEPAREIPPDQVSAAEEEEVERPEPLAEKTGRGRRLVALTTATLLTGIVALEFYRLADWGFSLNPVLGILILGLITLLLGCGLWQLVQALKGSRQLRRVARLRAQAAQLAESREQRHAARFIRQLEQHYVGTPVLNPLRQSIARLDSTYSDSEVIAFLGSQALKQQDEEARRCVQRYSIESGVLVALSPWASFDMLLAGWRNLRMLREIARIYSIAPGAATQWTLFRRILHGIAFAGLSETAMDAGSALLGTSLTSAISARTGQGIGAGLFTARTGLAAIELCRPLPAPAPGQSLSRTIIHAITSRTGEPQ